MRQPSALLALLVLSSPAIAHPPRPIVVDCSRGPSLKSVVSTAPAGSIIRIKGSCTGPLLITTDGLQLSGGGSASIDGGGQDTITVKGAQGITMNGLTITGGSNGLVIQDNAQATLENARIDGNAQTGIVVRSNSSATLDGGSSADNGLHGVDVESTSSLIVIGAYSSTGNAVFGLVVNNGSSLTLTAGNLSVDSNTVGIQLGTNASAFLDGQSTLSASNNLATGLTMVSGSHMVDFGGKITSSGNGGEGISLNAKAGLDLDAGSHVESSGNGADGIHMQQMSVMTVFNNPQFSGVPGTSTVTTHANAGNGISLLTSSELLVDNSATIDSQGNTKAGLALDDGSSASFGQTIPDSSNRATLSQNTPDVSVTFGSRLTKVTNAIFGDISCDATALIRGGAPITCPSS